MRNPYAPPQSSVADINDRGASISAKGLVKLFQVFVLTSTSIGLLLAFWDYLPILVSEDSRFALLQSGTSALSPRASEWLWWLSQPIWILAGIGLYFFQLWGRHLLILAYTISTVSGLLGGVTVRLPWENLLIALTTLMDGAVLLLAFTNPIAGYFVSSNSDRVRAED